MEAARRCFCDQYMRREDATSQRLVSSLDLQRFGSVLRPDGTDACAALFDHVGKHVLKSMFWYLVVHIAEELATDAVGCTRTTNGSPKLGWPGPRKYRNAPATASIDGPLTSHTENTAQCESECVGAESQDSRNK